MAIVWDLSSNELTGEQENFLEAASYTALEKIFISFIFAISSVGIISNVVGLYTLLRNRETWADEQFFLTGLAIADIVYLLFGFTFFVGPYATSPVSQHVPFHHCWRVVGIILFMQLVSTGVIIGIAAETYWRATGGNDLGATFSSHAYKLFVIVLLSTSLVLLALAVPAIFDDTEDSRPKELSVKWPNSTAYDNFPQNVRICSQEHWPYVRIVIFHDLIIFWFAVPLMIYFYGQTIKTIKKRQRARGKSKASNIELSTTGHGQAAEIAGASTNGEGQRGDTSRDMGQDRQERASPERILDPALNLYLRIAIYFGSQVICRLYNLSEAIKRDVTDAPLLPFLSMENELVMLIFRLFLMLQPAINPFVYFYGRDHMRRLLRNTFKFE